MVNDFLKEIHRFIQMDEQLYGRILIALTEAVNNGIMHGNKNDINKFVIVHCDCFEDRFEFSVQDQGDGFDPESIPDPRLEENLLKEGGRGVHIIRSMMSNVLFKKNVHGMEIFFSVKR